MSRFLISRSPKAFDQIASSYDEHFERDESGRLMDCYFSTWQKSSIKDDYFLSKAEGAAFYCGTLAYFGYVGLTALEKVFDDFSEMSFPDLLKKTSGCFAIAVYKNGKLYVFVDPSATFKAYYLSSGVEISNNLYALAKAHRDKLSINEAALVEQSFQYSVIGSETILNGVFKLQSGELYICEEGGGKKLKEHDVYSCSLPEALSVTEELKSSAKVISDGYGAVSVNMTGGLDSRLVLSSFLAANSKPKLVYGVGNSSSTNTKSSDRRIVDKFSEEFGLECFNIDWTLPGNFIEDWDSLLSKYGEYFSIYCGNRRLIEQYENFLPSVSNYTCFGYFGETFRNIERLESFNSDTFDVSELLENLYLYHGPNYDFLGDFKVKYRDNIFSKIGLICEKEGLIKDRLSKDDFQVIHNRYRSEADSKMSGFVNSIMHSSVILSNYSVQSKVRCVSYSDKLSKSYQLRLIYTLSPAALKIPLFSHGRECEIDERSLKEKNPVMAGGVKELVNRTPLIGVSARRLKSFFRKMKSRDFGEQYVGNYSRAWLNSRVVELQEVLELSIVHPERFYGDVRALVYYLMYLYLLANVFEKGYKFPPIESDS